MAYLQPLSLRDFSKGRLTQYSASNFLLPVNSVSDSLNVNYDTVIGDGVVRLGTTILGATIAANKTPLGMAEFVNSSGTPNLTIAVLSGASTATIYYYDTSWHASGATALSNTAYNRFATLGDYCFRVNGVQSMTSSTDGNTWGTTNCITTDSVIPSLIIRTKARLLVSGFSSYRSRVYFSSIIAPQSSPKLTWSTSATTGDWIDVNPDDNGAVTGFAETSNTCLVFKNNGMYRMDVVNKTVDTQNIFNIGAIAQESITSCQGVVYFFSGLDIRQTTGDFPEQISRLGVQDFIDAIPQANWSKVCSGTDGLNVYFGIGDVTVNNRALTNVVLKYSTRDSTWSVHSYSKAYKFFSQFTTSANGREMVGLDTAGDVQTINLGNSDDGTPIYYEQITQELDLGNRANRKIISDEIVAYAKNGTASTLQIKANENDWTNVILNCNKRVNISDSINVKGRFFKFKWFGSTTTTQPTLQGIYVETINDEGVVHEEE
jgi:hypothetical protein